MKAQTLKPPSRQPARLRRAFASSSQMRLLCSCQSGSYEYTGLPSNFVIRPTVITIICQSFYYYSSFSSMFCNFEFTILVLIESVAVMIMLTIMGVLIATLFLG